MKYRVRPCIDASGVYYIVQDKHWLFGWRYIGRDMTIAEVFDNPLIFGSAEKAAAYVLDNFGEHAEVSRKFLRV